MRIFKIAEDDPFRNEGVDPLESPLREQFEAEQDYIQPKDEDDTVSEFILGLKDTLDDLKRKITELESEQKFALETNNWEYFKKINVI